MKNKMFSVFFVLVLVMVYCDGHFTKSFAEETNFFQLNNDVLLWLSSR